MWLQIISVSMLPAIVLLSSVRYRLKLTKLCRRVIHRVRTLARCKVCVKSTHSFVFSNCTHGKAHSVLAAFDLYSETRPSLSLSPQKGEVLDEVLRRVAPELVLELGTHCGYSSIRMLRLLPPTGRLLTVEVDPETADLAEELILVAGFKHSQFQILTQSSAEAIPALRSHLGMESGTGLGVSLVLMDHDPQQYLPDLLALEREGLLSPAGCVLLVHSGHDPQGVRALQEHLRARPLNYSIEGLSQGLLEVHYHTDNPEV